MSKDNRELQKILEQMILNDIIDENIQTLVLDRVQRALKNNGIDIRLFYSNEKLSDEIVKKMDGHDIL